MNRHGEMSMRSLGPFLAIAFGLAWCLLALMILFTSQVEAVFGPVSGTNPLFILAVYAPGIAAILLVWWLRSQRPGALLPSTCLVADATGLVGFLASRDTGREVPGRRH